MAKRTRFFQNTIAMVYDFDGTLSPQPMQEYTVLPTIGVKPQKFWKEVSKEAEDTVSESMLVYMRLLLKKAESAEIHIGRKDLKRMGKKIRYFPGVKEWFSRVNNFVRKEGKGRIAIKHYIVSAGLKEILEGTSIRSQFARIYASEYHFDHDDKAIFPKLLITDTAKTQYLFRINKGKEDLAENINEHMAPRLRPIPFSNIIYIGDGITDVPRRMREKRIGSLLTIEAGEIVGIVTESDLVRKGLVCKLDSASTRVSAAMSSPLIGIDINRTIRDASQVMAEQGVRHLAVRENHKIVGVLSIRDLVKMVSFRDRPRFLGKT